MHATTPHAACHHAPEPQLIRGMLERQATESPNCPHNSEPLAQRGFAIAALPPGGTFVDDNGNPHEPDIEAIAAVGITRGCNPPTNDMYCPDRTVTRAEMASFFVRAFNIPTSSVNRFTDDDGNVHEAQINGIAAVGVTKGCNPPSNTLYCPDGQVTRGQMASFIARQLKLPVSTIDYFNDDSSSVHQGDINAIAKAGIAVPCGSLSYCPDQPLRRDVMATMLARSLNLTPIPPPVDPGNPPPPDLPSVTTAKDLFEGKVPTFRGLADRA